MNASLKLILWLLAGILLPFAAFYLLGSTNDHWTSLNIAGVVTLIFLFCFSLLLYALPFLH